MARSEAEARFGKVLGQIGERVIAPSLLRGLGLTELRNLNDWTPNHPFADLLGRWKGEYVAVAVRARVNWEKPQARVEPRLNSSFNGAGKPKIEKAVRLMRQMLRMGPVEPIRLLWLAIPVDLDDTFEAYWGLREQMTPIGGSDGRLRIPMSREAPQAWTDAGRRLAWRAPCQVPWDEHPGNWTFVAKRRWRQLEHITDRDLRIYQAICDVTPGIGWTTPAPRPAARCETAGTATVYVVRAGAHGENATRRKMAESLARGRSVPICIAVLDCLRSNGWTDMPALTRAMALRRNTQGQPWTHKSYSDPSNALEDNGRVVSRQDGRSILRRITPAGLAFLTRHSA